MNEKRDTTEIQAALITQSLLTPPAGFDGAPYAGIAGFNHDFNAPRPERTGERKPIVRTLFTNLNLMRKRIGKKPA